MPQLADYLAADCDEPLPPLAPLDIQRRPAYRLAFHWYAAAVRYEWAGDYATAERYWMRGDDIYARLGDCCVTWTDPRPPAEIDAALSAEVAA